MMNGEIDRTLNDDFAKWGKIRMMRRMGVENGVEIMAKNCNMILDERKDD